MGAAIVLKSDVIAVQIKNVRDPNGKEVLKATVGMNLLFQKDFDARGLEGQLARSEKRYSALVQDLKQLLGALRSDRQKKGRSLLYWRFGDKIAAFIEQSKNERLFVGRLTTSLERDVGVSDKVITRCRRFRALYSDVAKIDPTRSFDSYVAAFEGSYISKGDTGAQNA